MRKRYASGRRRGKRAAVQIEHHTRSKKAVGQRSDRTHPRFQPAQHARVARSFPFREPRAGQRTPVGAEAQPHLARIFAGAAGLIAGDHRVGEFTAGRNPQQRMTRLDLLAHEIADPLVTGEIVIVAPVGGRADAELFRAAAPVLDVVPRTERREPPDMVHIDFARVPRHRLGKAENIRPAAAEKIKPQPEIGRQLGVVPRVAADVVAPLAAVGVVGVHDIAVVPKTKPPALLLLPAIEIEIRGQLILDRRLGRRRAVHRIPELSKDAARLQILRRTRQQRGRGQHALHRGQLRALRRCRHKRQVQLARSRDTFGRVKPGLVILVGHLEAAVVLLVVGVLAKAVMIGPQIHRPRVRRPHPRRHGRDVTGGATDVELGGMALPKIPQAQHHAARRCADIAESTGPLPLGRIQPGKSLPRALADLESIGAVLHQRPIRVGRDVVEPAGHPLIPFGERRRGAAGDLSLPNRRPRIAPQARNAAHGLGKHTVLQTRETHVPVVERAAQRHGKRNAETRDKILRRVAVEKDRVHQPSPVAARVKIQPHHKRQPRPASAGMAPLQFHHRPHRPGLLKRHVLDLTDKIFRPDRARIDPVFQPTH